MDLVISNPSAPHISPVKVQAVLTDGDFSLALEPALIEALALSAMAQVRVAGRWQPCVGPVAVNCHGGQSFVPAIYGTEGVSIGRHLNKWLQDFTAAPLTAEDIYILLTRESSKDRIMVREQVVDAHTCKHFCAYAATQERIATHVVSKDGQGFLRKDIRDTYKHNTQGVEQEFRQLFHRIFTQHVEPFFRVEAEWWEPPFLLSYLPGGHYTAHADANEHWETGPDGTRIWKRVLDRDISVLVYLNDEFTGGKLDFPDHGITITPKPGLLVAFPSTERYRHAALPTESGEKFVIASWAVIRHSPRSFPRPSGNRIFMDEFK